jgi:bifunctional non-homologous end joining protein LigD
MSTREYRAKRDFARTPEPPGAVPDEARDGRPGRGRGDERRFVVQRHRARRLHYDLRLEVDGALASWAVPRGPTLDPDVRRMAVHVEDHPLEYVDFEGVIPSGEYGGGDVIVWDWGTWRPEPATPDPRAAIEAGELKFTLAGERLRGRFVLVRTSGRGGADGAPDGAGGQEQWLLIHKHDTHAVAGWDAEAHPRSVRSGLTNDEVREGRAAIWVGRAPVAEARIDLSAARPAALPRFIEPMAAALVADVPAGPDWLFEVKWDGFRLEAVVGPTGVRTWTRNGNDGDGYFPGLLDPPTWIDAREAVVDGEVVALDDAGRPDFGLLQDRLGPVAARPGSRVVYQAFDLLHVDGRSLLDVPLEERRKLLRLLLREHPRVRLSEHVVAEGPAFLAAAREQGLEGVLAKRRSSGYEPGQRSGAWLKVKVRPEQDLVVVGWTPARGNEHELGALVVAVRQDDRWSFAGKVGSGFTERTRAALHEELLGLVIEDPPVDPVPPPTARGRWGAGLAGVRWVRPALVIRAELGGWTADGMVRQAAFKGVDRGRDPWGVTRDRPVVLAEPPVAASEGPGSSTSGHPSAGVSGSGHMRRDPHDGAGPWPDPHDEARRAASAEELAALAALPGGGGLWEVGGQRLRLTNLDKVLFPPRAPDEAPVTKREVIGYFARIAPVMLAHLAGRPLNLHRYPNGAAAPGFWQKDLPASAPGWLTRWREPVPGDRGANTHVVADGLATLAWLGNQAAFELHAWTSTCADPEHPTFALVDIDPGTATTWAETLTLARLYRTALEHLGVRGLPKTTGARGIQVWIPVERGRYTYAETTAWVEALSRAVGATVPDLVSWEWTRADRGGRARLDYTQNASNRTLVAPYAIRPRPGAPVSVPIQWDELDDPALRSDRWTLRDALDRVAEVGDLFAPAQADAQVLPRL